MVVGEERGVGELARITRKLDLIKLKQQKKIEQNECGSKNINL